MFFSVCGDGKVSEACFKAQLREIEELTKQNQRLMNLLTEARAEVKVIKHKQIAGDACKVDIAIFQLSASVQTLFVTPPDMQVANACAGSYWVKIFNK